MSRLLKRRVAKSFDQATASSASPLLARLYANRGVVSEAEVDYSLSNLARPEGLKGIDQAAILLAGAVTKANKILIVGDFDADGATSCALMVHGLRSLGAASVDYLVPNRFEFGYGLTPEIVEVARTYEPSLIVTVDNGISSHEGINRARELGIQTLVTDHHLPPETLPAADAIVNPNQPGCSFVSKALAGVGVAFYLLSATRKVLEAGGWFKEKKPPGLVDYLDLVALGTIADVVPLDYNNRILVHEGLRRIRAGRCRPGIRALLATSGHRLETLSSQGLSFGVAPRLNAAGRLDDMALGIECLLAEQDDHARELASRLDALNRERKDIEGDMKDQALAQLKAMPQDEMLARVGVCLFDESWHQGVVGIVASRIKDKVHRPAIAFARVSEVELKGSARSIPGFHMRDALDAIATHNPGLVTRFGGHAMAAGLSLAPKDFARFAEEFNREAARWLTEDDLKHLVVTDGEINEPLSVPLARAISLAAPWGQGFPEPMFDAQVEIVDQRIVASRHLKLKVRLPDGLIYDAIAFNDNRLVEGRNRRIAFRLDVNEYRSLETVQLIVECLHIDGDG